MCIITVILQDLLSQKLATEPEEVHTEFFYT